MQWQRIKFTMGPAQLKLPKFDLSVRFEERREEGRVCWWSRRRQSGTSKCWYRNLYHPPRWLVEFHIFNVLVRIPNSLLTYARFTCALASRCRRYFYPFTLLSSSLTLRQQHPTHMNGRGRGISLKLKCRYAAAERRSKCLSAKPSLKDE